MTTARIKCEDLIAATEKELEVLRPQLSLDVEDKRTQEIAKRYETILALHVMAKKNEGEAMSVSLSDFKFIARYML